MTGDKPWPEVPIGNKDHANAAVVIIGAGICTAIDLITRNNCKNFIILEKSSGVGGTWHDNKYPGACCDVWSQLYSYSFAQHAAWTREYPGQEEILSYLMGVASQHNLYQHIRFNSTVENATWNDETKKWKVSVSTAKGSKDAEFCEGYDIETSFLVSAVGQLNVPKWPDVPGISDFEGKIIHSARWDWSYDLKDKKIAVVGNGATAVQIIPEIAKVASKVGVYQRTPNWLIPRLDAPIPSYTRALFHYLPPLMWRKRALQMDFRESFYAIIGDTSSAGADEIRNLNIQMLENAFPDDETMREKLLPEYNPGCKRIIISDDYYPTLALPHVNLYTDRISRITSTGITTSSNETEDYDLIVLATGFETLDFMHPISMTGFHGTPLSSIWSHGAKALYGITVSQMPNFAMLYGPNTNLGHNSIILMIEAQSRYIASLISPVLSARKIGKSLSLRPKDSRMKEFNEHLQAELKHSAFADPKCNSWYKTSEGLITNNWSGNVVDYQEMVAKVQWSDYEIEGDGKEVLEGRRETKIGRVKEESVVGSRVLGALGVVSVGAVLVAGWWARGGGRLGGLRVR
ncbi:cyclohexanone monooxygenase [Aureobasidium sp. EXF-3400]|nr:cyclohexanone monooxygenase [Aureobasidium sp. EXF-12344]KAI4775046.1 cyclohexanone monooxygenase [Aureobasidium sp. EXF-3400]